MRWPWQRKIPRRPIRPSEVVWPMYTIDSLCPYLDQHPEHFWSHPSGLLGACRGRTERMRR